MSICVIFNPHAGRRRSQRRIARFLDHWRDRVDVRPTEYAGHAVDLARAACDQDFAVVAAAGGDGTAHDVANGILLSGRDDVTFAVVPVGSANDYAWTLARQVGASQLDDNVCRLVDVGHVRSSDGRQRFFIEGLGTALSGRVTLEARRIARLQGILLYGLAAWRALAQHRPLPLRLQWDDQPPISKPTLLLCVMLGCREGNFVLAPQARLDDGLFEAVHAGNVGRWEAVRMLPRLALYGPPANHPEITLHRCRTLHVSSEEPLAIHTDGELFSTPEEGVRDAEIRLLPSRLRVKLCLPDLGQPS